MTPPDLAGIIERDRLWCVNGHARYEVGTYKRPDGREECRACRRDAQAKQRRDHPRPHFVVRTGTHRDPNADALTDARFWAYIAIPLFPECWKWNGPINGDGYGQFTVRLVLWRAHRYAYELFVGPIPDGLQIDHLCRNRACVNPAHMEVVTLAENVRRGEGVSAVNAGRTHCPKGHPYDEANTYRYRKGAGWARQCRACTHDRLSRRPSRPEKRRLASLRAEP